MSESAFPPGSSENTVRSANSQDLTIPNGWVHLTPGNAILTRRVKAAGDQWIIQEKKGRTVVSRGRAISRTFDGLSTGRAGAGGMPLRRALLAVNGDNEATDR